MAADRIASPESEKEKHLHALNDKIQAVAPIAHPFSETDLFMGSGETDTTPLVETKEAVDVGDGHILTVISANFGTKPDGSPNMGAFTPMFRTESAWNESGAVQIVEAKAGEDVPQEFNNEIGKGDEAKQKELNSELESLGTGDKRYRSLNIPNLISYKVHDVNPGRFVVVSATNTEGQTFPVALNMMDRNTGMEGHIFVARHPTNGDFALLEQPKPVVGERKIGPPQGFAGPLEVGATAYAGLRDELGIEGMTRSLKLNILEEDLGASMVDDRFFLLSLNARDEEVLSRPDVMQNMEVQLEKLAKRRMSRQEVLQAIKEDKINGAHAVAGIALSLLDRGEVALNEDFDANNNGLVLTQVRPAFDPTRIRVTLPKGSPGVGEVAGGLYADPTKFRDQTPVMAVRTADLNPGEHFFASYAEIMQTLKGGVGPKNPLGVVETAAIFTHALKKGIIVPTFR
jgi:hypothetical protein